MLAVQSQMLLIVQIIFKMGIDSMGMTLSRSNTLEQQKVLWLQDNLHVHTGALESTHYKTMNVMIIDVCQRNHAWLLPFVKCTSIFHMRFVH